MFKEHARRTVQLANDNAFRTVNHERTGVRHEWNFTHVDFLFFHFLDLAGIAVEDHQTDTSAQRRSKSQAALLAFAYIKRWLCQVVANEFQTGVARMRRDRENGRKGGLQTLRTTLCRRDSLLQEITEGVELGRQKVRYLEHRFTLRKTFANALFLGK